MALDNKKTEEAGSDLGGSFEVGWEHDARGGGWVGGPRGFKSNRSGIRRSGRGLCGGRQARRVVAALMARWRAEHLRRSSTVGVAGAGGGELQRRVAGMVDGVHGWGSIQSVVGHGSERTRVSVCLDKERVESRVCFLYCVLGVGLGDTKMMYFMDLRN